MNEYIYNFKKYRPLLKELVLRDIKLKYRRSVLGILWSILNPLLMMLVLTIVFSTLFKRSIDNFPVYLLCGRIIFDFYSQSTREAMTSIVSNGILIRKVYIPKYIFPISKGISTFVNLLFSLIALFIVMIVTNVKITWAIMLIPLPLIYIFIFSIGIGLTLAAYTVFFRDIVHLYSVVLTAWMYLTPLFYPVEIIPDSFKFVIYLNPLYYIIECFREIVLYGQIISLQKHLICILISLFSIVFGIIVFKKKQDKFILYI
ncbi:ABC transporter permease [Tepidibacter formicigenes]|uniref:Transport permease protein n=1 Tax=Tepidibacter formicigenes DSM 15518 TaxID=1123349 RepID=A0A1M6QV41_9FIRM|nr:ABC transporter permease [Tepidibacter formicigenes]SHK24101.1 ABC-2 type transport system permease protein [Tepidibacter formicigenes DSM 15518]